MWWVKTKVRDTERTGVLRGSDWFARKCYKNPLAGRDTDVAHVCGVVMPTLLLCAALLLPLAASAAAGTGACQTAMGCALNGDYESVAAGIGRRSFSRLGSLEVRRCGSRMGERPTTQAVGRASGRCWKVGFNVVCTDFVKNIRVDEMRGKTERMLYLLV